MTLDMEYFDVTCAIIIDKKKLLVCQRGENSDHPNEWEFPGGKVESGETPEDCIIREIKEELGIRISIKKQLFYVEHDYGFKKIRLIPFLCKIEEGIPLAIEHKSVKWYSFDLFDELKWSAADKKLFYINKDFI